MQGGLAGQPRGLAQQRNSAIHCTSSLLMLCSKLLQEAALAAAQYADSWLNLHLESALRLASNSFSILAGGGAGGCAVRRQPGARGARPAREEGVYAG